MPATNEWSLTSEIATWITQAAANRIDLPFSEARVEKPVRDSRQRHDLIIYGRDGKPALSGEFKMPDKANGGTPFNEILVKDAQNKADSLGVEYFFTWNVNRCVLWRTFEKGKGVMERHVEQFVALSSPIRHSDEAEQPLVQKQLRDFIEKFLGRCAAILKGEQALKLPPPDELFLTVWEAALEQPVVQTLYALSQRYDKDIPFTRQLDKWMREEQGWIISHTDDQVVRENLERAAKYACYVLATKIIFYKALRRRFNRMRALQVGDDLETGAALLAKLQEFFEHAMQTSGDYQTVFKTQYGDEIACLSDVAVDNWRELSKQTDGFDFTRLDYEIVGQIFERMLSNPERHKYGQHYTRSEIVDLINAFCIRNPNDVVFDPACGGGTFLVRAYTRKKDLANGAISHNDLLNQLYGLDISAYPAHLTTMNLATRDLSNQKNYPLVARQDFFKVKRDDAPFVVPDSGQTTLHPLGEVDAVVGNPPYVRQEKITEYYGAAYKKELQEQMRRDTPNADLSGRSDIHCFFFTHALTFLKWGGVIGLLVSSTWLDTGYGFRLQKFILDNFEIVAVFESAVEPWFTGARVTTAAVILRQQSDPVKRAANTVRFALLTRPISELTAYAVSETDRRLFFENLRDRVESMRGTEEFTICPGEGEPIRVRQETAQGLRVRLVQQSDLKRLGRQPIALSEADEEEDEAETAQTVSENAPEFAPQGAYTGYKWGIFLRAPDIFFKLLRRGGAAFVPLNDVAQVKRGITSGCDKFFFVKDVTAHALAELPNREEFINYYGIAPEETAEIRLVHAGDGSLHRIEARYLEPVAFNLMEMDTAKVEPARLKKHILLVSDEKEALAGTHVLKYIEWGEDEGFQNGSSCKSRRRWYELPIPERGYTLWTMTQRYRYIVPINNHNVICNKRLFNISGSNEKLNPLLSAILNSTIVALSRYCFGRIQGGDPVLETEVVDVKMLLIPDPRRATPAAQQKLVAALASMQKRSIGHLVAVDSSDNGPTGDLAQADRQALDDAVLELLGIADPAERAALRAELYAEITALYRGIRAAEKRMNQFKSRTNNKGKVTAHSIAAEIWETLETKPRLKSLPDFAAHYESEILTLPPGKAHIVNNLLNAHSLRVDSDYIPLESPERAQYAKALSDLRLFGLVSIPRSPDDCKTALRKRDEEQRQLEELFDETAAEYTADEALQKRIVAELWRKAKQQTD